MQEDLEQRSVVLATNTTKLTARVLAALMRTALRKMKNARDAPVEGKQSVQQLAKGGTLESVEVTDGNIKSFDPFARKFGVSYALQCDKTESPPKWLIYFRSKDTASMSAAFKAFTTSMVKRDKSRESVLSAITRLRKRIKTAVRDKTKHKTHGEHEL